MLGDVILRSLIGNLEICCNSSSVRSAFMRESLDMAYDIPRCIHYNVAEGEMS